MTVALDGSGSASNSTGTVNVSFSTTSSGVIIVAVVTNATGVQSGGVTAAGLTFTKRIAFTNTNSNDIEEWWAPYSGATTWNIQVVVTSAAFAVVTAFGISGADAFTVFDGNVPAAITGSSSPLSITTTNPNNDFIYYNYASTTASNTQGAGWTLINGSNFQLVAYQVNAAGTYSGTVGSGGSVGGTMDAVIQSTGYVPNYTQVISYALPDW